MTLTTYNGIQCPFQINFYNQNRSTLPRVIELFFQFRFSSNFSSQLPSTSGQFLDIYIILEIYQCLPRSIMEFNDLSRSVFEIKIRQLCPEISILFQSPTIKIQNPETSKYPSKNSSYPIIGHSQTIPPQVPTSFLNHIFNLFIRNN